MSQKEVRFAIIGCGRVAKNHVGPLTEIPRAKLVAICDLSTERSEPISDKHHIPAYTNYHEMLQKEQIDVVNILTPSGMHPTHAIDIMERYGKHVVVEKPIVLNLADLDRMKEVAQKKNVKVFPNYQNRYNKAVQKVRADILSGAFGKLVLGTVRLRWCRPQRYYDRDPWRGTWAMDGGALTNQGIHYLDLIQYLMGDVDTAFVRTATQLVTVEVEDTAVGVVTFKSGVMGAVEIVTAARPDDFEASISIMGEKGVAVVTGISANKLSTYTIDPGAMPANSEEFPDAYGFGHWPFFKDVVADLLDGVPHPLSFEEGSRAIRLLNTFYRSSEENRVVKLSEGLASKNLGRRDLALEKLYTTPSPSK